MRVRVRALGGEAVEVRLRRGATVADLLAARAVNPVTVLATRDGALVPEDEGLAEGDEVLLYPAMSGG